MRILGDIPAPAFAVRPGVVATQLGRDYPGWLMSMAKVFMMTPENGAGLRFMWRLSRAEKKAAAEARSYGLIASGCLLMTSA
ncbi:MAG TPA: hypothetical protein VFO10_29325 [Oligoflexus sp.]|uniref:hypothetical protein n=1 Tax=Oligoflexus sp. TaxID=1971216 RepID=UPI002D7FC322|nr:hypothetical protein [Oligoflexus sp.]HET9241404.1 hypothetical protein [Oligoflexus sp.]